MIGVIDYGMGNIQSVLNAFARIGTPARTVTSGSDLAGCEALVLPGVGAFSKAMSNLRAAGMVDGIRGRVADGVPLLGICLGLQLLADESEEHGRHEGLGIIPGRVRTIPVPAGYHLPHIGWNGVSITTQGRAGLFAGVPDDSCFYFVHSYALECDSRFVAATTDHGVPIVAAVQSGSVWAAQFHPEKSQANGFRLLRNFVQHMEMTLGPHA